MERARSIAELMEERGVDLEGLLRATGLDRRIVEAIIHGRYTPSPQQRQRLAAAFAVSPADIAWGYSIPVQHIQGHGPQFGRSP